MVNNLWLVVLSVDLLLIQMFLEHFFAHDKYWGLVESHLLFLIANIDLHIVFFVVDFMRIKCLVHDALSLEVQILQVSVDICWTIIIEFDELSLLENLVKFELTKAIFEVIKAVGVRLLSIWDRVEVFTQNALLLLFLSLSAIV